jgi:serine/threonine protein phosphatase PrpC
MKSFATLPNCARPAACPCPPSRSWRSRPPTTPSTPAPAATCASPAWAPRTQPAVTPDVVETQVEPGDLFLLCSDGLSRELPDERIEAILNTTKGGLNPTAATLDELCARLIQAANKAGGNDNITCLLIRVE